jgi:hypothetical protein
MLPVIGQTRGRQISLGGGGDTKDKLLVGGLGVVIVVALVALVWSIVGKSGPTGPAVPDMFHLGCISPACGHEWEVTKDQFYARIREMGEREISMPRFKCPKCNDARFTGFVMNQCPYPTCQKWFFENRVLKFAQRPTTEPQMCPYCKQNIADGMRQFRSGKK